MLLLSRRVGESIFIGEGAGLIEITVTEIKASQVRIGIKAPANVKILRNELARAAEVDGNK